MDVSLKFKQFAVNRAMSTICLGPKDAPVVTAFAVAASYHKAGVCGFTHLFSRLRYEHYMKIIWATWHFILKHDWNLICHILISDTVSIEFAHVLHIEKTTKSQTWQWSKAMNLAAVSNGQPLGWHWGATHDKSTLVNSKLVIFITVKLYIMIFLLAILMRLSFFNNTSLTKIAKMSTNLVLFHLSSDINTRPSVLKQRSPVTFVKHKINEDQHRASKSCVANQKLPQTD